MYELSSVTPSSTQSFSLASVVLNSMLPKGAHHIMKDKDDADINHDDDIESNVYYRHQDGKNACSSPKQHTHPFDEDSSGDGGDAGFNVSRSTTMTTTTGIGFKSYGPSHGYDVFAGIIEQKKQDKERGIDECDYFQKEEEDSVFDGIQ
ncbi:hypothetical protein FRACYDRAFT_269590 [Fragilariopsis cylindrus CCMP1102]|uniref:Uncharacterized protein n=1 Tax=Fragilariopsis cylindrus CCMP1102 TaxID=635003 RepID=A0A1E7F8I0_9STRA|nr:hypothetical protein FRACYDRAFT_269590 [Fragilariopsis cylindrus CCMP1102]|eukprot:OEU14467.1 hypothetical protein FRACYDRAFT_269590 [Fragilariopsis cylindrus CCMP1102]